MVELFEFIISSVLAFWFNKPKSLVTQLYMRIDHTCYHRLDHTCYLRLDHTCYLQLQGGSNGIKGLAKVLSIMDDNGDRRLNRDELRLLDVFYLSIYDRVSFCGVLHGHPNNYMFEHACSVIRSISNVVIM